MTGGGGRCLRLRKTMGADRGAAEMNKIENNNNSPNSEITKKPLNSTEITELPLSSLVEFDFYSQARKVLSFRSPFDSEDSPARPVSISGASTLPGGLSHLLSRHSDGRKRHKKLHLGSKKKSSSLGRPPAGNIWDETEEYFRELTTEDTDRLEPVSVVAFSGIDKCFFIPSLDGNNTLSGLYAAFNRMLGNACEQGNLKSANEVELTSDRKAEVEGKVGQEDNVPHSMDVDGDDGEINNLEIKEEIHVEKTDDRNLTFFSGVEWLLGSKTKIYLASDRPSKKQKLWGKDAGSEKLLVVHPVRGSDFVCHYCCCGDMGDLLNCLIKCGSCGMTVHQRCYGVQEDVDSSWLCSWCERKNYVDLSTERPCLLCPKQGGALKPVRKRGLRSENESLEVEFAHLFCCQWMPEVYVENPMTMEPIMNPDELKDTRKKLLCYLCKVKYGACVFCSNGDCRTSFHPICAREARHRMEIWGRLGCEEVELRAFCAKHSEGQENSGSQSATDISLTADMDRIKLNDIVLDGENVLGIRPNSKPHTESDDSLRPADKDVGNENDNKEVTAHSSFNFTMILKKLIDLGKVDAKDVASDIGVSANSLNTMLTDNHMVPKVEYKLVKWLKNHAHIGSTQKTFKVKIGSLVALKAEPDVAGGPGAVSQEESDSCGTVCVKSVPPCRRTKSRIRIMKDDNSSLSRDKINGGTPADVDMSLLGQCLSKDGLAGETKQYEQMTTCSFVLTTGEVVANSYIHPFIYSKLMQAKSHVLEKLAYNHSAGYGNRVVSHLEASSSTGPCCNNHNLQAPSGDWTSVCRGVELDQLVKARNPSLLKLSPADEVEGELIYYQQRLVCNAIARKHISDGLVSKVVKGLAREVDAAGKRKWDAVFVSQYHHGLREAKKQGRKKSRHKEAQAVLAAAASSRVSSIRKDILEESAHHEDRLKLNISGVRPGVHSKPNARVKPTSKPSLAKNSDLFQLASDFSKEHPGTCDICRRFDTILNPVLVCSSCKVAVHLDCYCSVKSPTGPWHCELCEDLSANFWKKPYFVAECGLCGGTAGAFRKSVDGQWIHALCAEWVLESTYRRGQVNPIERMETVCKEIDACTVCFHKRGVCLKCSNGHCRSTFHPTCARSAGFYMTVRNNGGKLQHKAYCEKHSSEQRAKADTHRHGIEEFKSLKQVRVEFERLRLLCERIIKREKLKRELVRCSHDILASKRESVLSALARHPFYQPEVSSESATTSLKGCTDSYMSGSETRQRSDDITVDSTVAGKRRIKISLCMDNDQKTVDSSTSQSVYVPKPIQRISFSGKQIPQRFSLGTWNLSNDGKATNK